MNQKKETQMNTCFLAGQPSRLFQIRQDVLNRKFIFKQTGTAAVLICLAALLAPLISRAQLVADGATNTLSNITNSFTGDVIVGTNGAFTLLVLSDNALLTNSANGSIGLNSTAKF